MKIIADSQKIEEILSRGVENIIEKESLLKKLKSGKPLRIKHGIDPTGPKIHLGRAVQFWKLKTFQDLGHKIVLIIGDFTGQIGDASDKESMRPILSEEQVKKNMKDYLPQIGKILDIGKTEVRYNSEWFGKMSLKEILDLATHFTAQQTVLRRNFQERWEAKKPIGLHELFYPLLQGYDSVMVRADLELGGADQLFNLKIGRDIQRLFGKPPQDIMTLKMLPGTDGEKMSTSRRNVINISDEPNDMFGKIMSMKDEVMEIYFELATSLDLREARKKIKESPRAAKALLAKEIASLYHGKKAGESAEKEFEKVFKNKELPTEIPEIKIAEKEIAIADLLIKSGLAPSKSEARRLIEQRGVKIDGEIQSDAKKSVKIEKEMVIQAGKRRFARIIPK
jgi:tyrosyl-tRNA synthetase